MSEQLTDDQQAALDEMKAKAAEEQNGTAPPPPSKEVATVDGTLSVDRRQDFWTDRQLAALSTIGLEEVPRDHLGAFLHICQRTGLDPFAREIYYIGRKDDALPGGKRYTAQTGIDGFRHIAERTGEYDGKEGPWWCGRDGEWKEIWTDAEPPVAAKFSVYRKGMARPVTATAHYREFVPMVGKWEGPRGNRRKVGEEPNAMWQKMPAHMLAKCAEALAHRQAFPRQLAGVYTDDEMGVADARAADDAKRAADEERAQQRREYVQGFGPGEPLSPGETAEGDVIEGEVVVLDREELMAELTAQADVLGKTVAQHGTRWAATHKRNIVDATDEELLEFLVSNRARVAARLAQQVEDVAQTTIIPPLIVDVELPDTDDDDEPLIVDVELPTEKVDPDAPHPYQDWSGKCIVCLKVREDGPHVEAQ